MQPPIMTREELGLRPSDLVAVHWDFKAGAFAVQQVAGEPGRNPALLPPDRMSEITLRDVRFVVDEAARQAMLASKTGEKTLHAFAYGTPTLTPRKLEWDQIRYNPYATVPEIAGQFHIARDDVLKPVQVCRYVKFQTTPEGKPLMLGARALG